LIILAVGGWIAFQTYQVSVEGHTPLLASGPQLAPQQPLQVRVLPQAPMQPALAMTRLTFPPLTVDEAKLETERAAQRAQAQAISTQDPALRALTAEVRGWGLRVNDMEVAGRALEAAAQAVLGLHGEAGLARVVEEARAEFEAMLRARGHAQPLPKPPTQGASAWLAAVSGAAVEAALRDVGLEVSQFAREVFEPEGLASLWPMVGVLFRHQWSQRLCGKGEPCLLTPYERLLLRRWQVERSRAPLPQKIRLIKRARQESPSYDWLRVEVTLLDQAGMRDEAHRLVQAALAAPQADAASAQALRALAESLRD
jgi:hypothetical protein